MINIHEAKHRVINSIRNYFNKTGAIEVFTPIMNQYPNLDTYIYPVELNVENSSGEKFKVFLHTSPEYQMKKILSEIKKDIYQISHVFRNKEGSKIHTIEFLMLEWYRVNFDLNNLINDTKNIIITAAESLFNKPLLKYKGKLYDLNDWEIISVDEAFERFTGILPQDKDSMIKFLQKTPIAHPNINNYTYEELFHLIYSIYIEKKLGQEKPTIIHSYPKELSALAEIKGNRGLRFEAYIGGIELVNGYQELTNPYELRIRLKKEIDERKKEGNIYPLDEEFVKCTENLPASAGASLGIDRLMMILLNMENIKDTQGLNWI